MTQFWRVAILALTFFSAFPATSNAQSSNEVIRAFQKLHARIDTGISLHDYRAALADAKFELKNFEDDSANNPHAPAIKELKAAMDLHTEAILLWQQTIGRYGTHYLPQQDAATNAYLERYPDSAKTISEGGANMTGMGLYIEALIPFLWKDASTHLEKARTMFAQKGKKNEQPKNKAPKEKKNAA